VAGVLIDAMPREQSPLGDRKLIDLAAAARDARRLLPRDPTTASDR
jgi:hypothetical protein